MSVFEKMTAIADAIRGKTGQSDPLTLDGMAEAVPQVYAAGKSEAEQICAAKHYTAMYTPSEDALYFDLPIDFIPDMLTIYSTAPDAQLIAGCEMLKVHRYVPTIGTIMGLHSYNSTGGTNGRMNGYFTTSGGGYSQLTKTDTGYRISNGVSGGVQLYFKAGLPYCISAIRTDDRSDRERLTEFVQGLDDAGGTAYVMQLMRDNAFAEEEWLALIAQKPNWTFVLK